MQNEQDEQTEQSKTGFWLLPLGIILIALGVMLLIYVRDHPKASPPAEVKQSTINLNATDFDGESQQIQNAARGQLQQQTPAQQPASNDSMLLQPVGTGVPAGE